jgi:hypothetical protein
LRVGHRYFPEGGGAAKKLLAILHWLRNLQLVAKRNQFGEGAMARLIMWNPMTRIPRHAPASPK